MKPQKLRTTTYFSFLFSILCFLSFILPDKAEAAASLYLVPSAGTYTVGNTFSVELRLNSGGVPINAADGTLVFETNDLEVRSISKENSVFSFWVQEPIFSNSLGTVNFAGGKPSPGFTGAAGTIMTIVFKGKTAGSADLTFAAGSVLADDGKGTNILSTIKGGNYTLVAREITVPPSEPVSQTEPAPTPNQAPAAPIISSSSHPDENKWYSNNDPEFNWQLPSDVAGVSLLLHKNLTANPGPISDGLLESKKYEDIEDGEWYFHIKFRNEYGWGETLHRKVLIDTKPPEPFQVVLDNENDATNPKPLFFFETADFLSGVEYYEVNLNERKFALAPQNIKDNPWQLSPHPPGEYALEVKAYDKAGNFALAQTEFQILPIKGVEITKIPISVRLGEPIVVEGKAEPEAIVRIYIQNLGKEPISEKVKADSSGKFTLSYDKALVKGDYVIWAQAEDERGALSEPTQKYDLEVGLPPFLKIGKIAIDYLTTVITLIILIVGAIAVIFYVWYRVSFWRRRIKKETKEVSKSVASAFKALREEVEEQVSIFDRKPGLTKEEKKIRDKLQEALDVSERFIVKEIEDVEKELE